MDLGPVFGIGPARDVQRLGLRPWLPALDLVLGRRGGIDFGDGRREGVSGVATSQPKRRMASGSNTCRS